MEEKKEEEKKEECAAATWLSEEIESLASEVGLSKESIPKLKEITEALAREVFLKSETCMQVKKEDKKTLKDLCNEDGEKIISSAENPKRTPLIFDSVTDKDRPTLYFRRQFLEEDFIAKQVKEMMNKPKVPLDDKDKKGVKAICEMGEKEEQKVGHEEIGAKLLEPLDPQQTEAVEHILQNQLSLISGGPGTGKTTLLFRALICVLKKNLDAKIVLAAPTGKAAARIGESIANQEKKVLEKSEWGKAVGERVLEKLDAIRPMTIHNMLGIGKDGKRRHEEEKLDADVIAIDETSMVSQDLMAKILHARPEKAKLILLGDSNQLDSVEPGHVFGDLCAATGIKGAFVELTESHRIPKKSFLGKLSKAVLEGRTEDAKNSLEANKEPSKETTDTTKDVSHKSNEEKAKGEPSDATEPSENNEEEVKAGENIKIFLDEKKFEEEFEKLAGKIFPESVWKAETKSSAKKLLDKELLDAIKNAKKKLLETTGEEAKKKLLYEIEDAEKKLLEAMREEAKELLKEIEDARILSPVRNGRFGVDWANAKLREKFSKNSKKDSSGIFYNRLPILITQNDKSSGLNNGDVGVILENASGKFEAWFKNLVDEEKNLKPLPTSKLPAYETAYATTVHKAQGSEFSHLAVMLPKSKSVEKICTRELLYTALTRHNVGKDSNPNRFLALFINLESLEKCVKTQTSSHSLLSARLKEC